MQNLKSKRMKFGKSIIYLLPSANFFINEIKCIDWSSESANIKGHQYHLCSFSCFFYKGNGSKSEILQ